jgi:hypothetical protein
MKLLFCILFQPLVPSFLLDGDDDDDDNNNNGE